MMPACTGLPPGELISSTTALAPSSSKAVRMAATTASALASAADGDFALDLDHRRVRQSSCRR